MQGISLAGLRAIEAGTAARSPDFARLLRLARALGVEPTALIQRAEELSAECRRFDPPDLEFRAEPKP